MYEGDLNDTKCSGVRGKTHRNAWGNSGRELTDPSQTGHRVKWLWVMLRAAFRASGVVAACAYH